MSDKTRERWDKAKRQSRVVGPRRTWKSYGNVGLHSGPKFVPGMYENLTPAQVKSQSVSWENVPKGTKHFKHKTVAHSKPEYRANTTHQPSELTNHNADNTSAKAQVNQINIAPPPCNSSSDSFPVPTETSCEASTFTRLMR